MRSFQKLFPRKASVDNVLSALENVVTLSGKPDWLSPFLLMYFLNSSSEVFFKMAVYLKHFTNFRESIRDGVFFS